MNATTTIQQHSSRAGSDLRDRPPQLIYSQRAAEEVGLNSVSHCATVHPKNTIPLALFEKITQFISRPTYQCVSTVRASAIADLVEERAVPYGCWLGVAVIVQPRPRKSECSQTAEHPMLRWVGNLDPSRIFFEFG